MTPPPQSATPAGVVLEGMHAPRDGWSPEGPGQVLALRGVDVNRGGKRILSDVELSVDAGQHWAMLGSNGAGKTTMVSLMAASMHPSAGTVRVLGHLLGRVDMRELRGFIGHVDPRHRVPSTLRAIEVVHTGLTGSNDRVPRWEPSLQERARAEDLVDSLRLRGVADTGWHQLSHGERGRVLIARALMPQPRLLLLDEPATGLDVASREQLLRAVDELSRDHPRMASVIVTHHLEELPATTTHVVLLRDGRIVAIGSIEDVLTDAALSRCFDYPLQVHRVGRRWSMQGAG